jgi:glycine/D-amino acid oxidase-like deaminating enzyme
MTAILPERRLVDPAFVTARPSLAFPFPHDVDVAPQLLVVTLAQAALAAAHRAIDSAHPVLALAAVPGKCPSLSDSEHYAMLILATGNELAKLLADYAAAVVRDNLELDDDSPF